MRSNIGLTPASSLPQKLFATTAHSQPKRISSMLKKAYKKVRPLVLPKPFQAFCLVQATILSLRTAVFLLLSTIKEDKDRSKWESQAEQIRKVYSPCLATPVLTQLLTSLAAS